jgi:glucokinase
VTGSTAPDLRCATVPEPVAAARTVVGVDVGGTKVLGLLVRVPPAGAPEILAEVSVPSEAATPGVIDAIAEVIARLVGRDPGGAAPVGLGIGLAGFVDPGGVVRRAPNTPGLLDVDVPLRLAERGDARLDPLLAGPVIVDNDANCTAVAAHAVLAPEARHLVAVTFGTGIGGGLIVDGNLVRGAHGFAGEPGHMVVDPAGPPCPCGQSGCWERYASGSGLGRLAREAASAGRAPSLVAAAGSVEAIRGEHVTAGFLAGAPDALEVVDVYAGWVALGVANLVALLDCEVVVLGGGVVGAGEAVVARVRATIERDYPAATAGRGLRVLAAPRGPGGGALGAAVLAARAQG